MSIVAITTIFKFSITMSVILIGYGIFGLIVFKILQKLKLSDNTMSIVMTIDKYILNIICILGLVWCGYVIYQTAPLIFPAFFV